MDIAIEKDGAGLFTHQLRVNVALGLPVRLKVICRSSSRNETSYEIFDQHGTSMGVRTITYATGKFNAPLVDDLNVLLAEFDVTLNPDEFEHVSKLIVETCEARYGYSIPDGDAVITIS